MNRRTVLKALALLPAYLLAGTAQAGPKIRTLTFRQMYSRVTFKGAEFSPLLKSLNGQTVRIRGYMAPPLKPKLDFFVLTRYPMASCPFCSEEEDWPADIVLVKMPRRRNIDPTKKPVEVQGRLELGAKKDPETGFLSMVRVYADRVKTL